MAEETVGFVHVDEEKPDLSWPSIRRYFATRHTTLFQLPERTGNAFPNPMPGLRAMELKHWNWYFLGFLAWVVDAMDFFVVSSTAPQIAETLGVSITDITWGMTLVLMVRSIGAIIFGVASDYYGRKWPYIACCAMFVVLEIGVGFCQTYDQFLAIRALFGISMGGMYGCAAATALENVPKEARSILSGLFLPGYTLGFLLAIVFARAFEDTYKPGEGWRALCWFTAGPAFVLMVWRMFMPESDYFLRVKAQRQLQEKKSWRQSWDDFKLAISTHWVIFLYLILFMAGLNFMSHGCQDLYPTFLTNQIGLSSDAKTVSMVVINLGAIVGGIFFGQLSEYTGRRLGFILACILGGAFSYPAFFLRSQGGLMVCAFFLQFAVGCWGIQPIHLFELTPNKYRALASGLAYQLGNLASSASSTIESTMGSKFPLPGGIYDYGKVMAIFTGAVFAYMILIVFVGPEKFHKNLDDIPTEDDMMQKVQSNDVLDNKKPEVQQRETV
ncbi:hypothetical protein TRICI_000198 [Trichomonascus ciferrii]|uniref:Major facilitator superfamily (MFS) profile domain-containing protein n=1 Tax=Trichomonascus ciferrii TaxID=44093 RepID=A0A642VE43_9ASCO|nr:hypothetical protein TRICI_000198 [Trichomonascus ciferrii]